MASGVQAWGPRGVFALTAVFPLVVSAAAVLIDEQPAAGPRLIKPDRAYLSALNTWTAACRPWMIRRCMPVQPAMQYTLGGS